MEDFTLIVNLRALPCFQDFKDRFCGSVLDEFQLVDPKQDISQAFTYHRYPIDWHV